MGLVGSCLVVCLSGCCLVVWLQGRCPATGLLRPRLGTVQVTLQMPPGVGAQVEACLPPQWACADMMMLVVGLG